MRYKAVEIDWQDIKLAIVCMEVEMVSRAFGTAGRESVARHGVSGSTDKVFVEAHAAPH